MLKISWEINILLNCKFKIFVIIYNMKYSESMYKVRLKVENIKIFILLEYFYSFYLSKFQRKY